MLIGHPAPRRRAGRVVVETVAPKAAHRKGPTGILSLIRFAAFVKLRVEERFDARHPVFVGDHEAGDAEHGGAGDGQRMGPTHARHQEHDRRNRPQRQGGAHVDLHEDQPQHRTDDQAAVKDPVFERADLSLVPVDERRQRKDQGELGDLRRLQLQAAKLHPAMGAVVLHANAGQKHQHQQQHGNPVSHPRHPRFPAAIIHQRKRATGDQPQGQIHHLGLEQPGVAGGNGAVQRDTAQHQQGRHTGDENGCRSTHAQYSAPGRDRPRARPWVVSQPTY